MTVPSIVVLGFAAVVALHFTGLFEAVTRRRRGHRARGEHWRAIPWPMRIVMVAAIVGGGAAGAWLANAADRSP